MSIATRDSGLSTRYVGVIEPHIYRVKSKTFGHETYRVSITRNSKVFTARGVAKSLEEAREKRDLLLAKLGPARAGRPMSTGEPVDAAPPLNARQKRDRLNLLSIMFEHRHPKRRKELSKLVSEECVVLFYKLIDTHPDATLGDLLHARSGWPKTTRTLCRWLLDAVDAQLQKSNPETTITQ